MDNDGIIVGFTGSREGMAIKQKLTLRAFLKKNATQFIHGDCEGSDEEAHYIAEELKLSILIYPPQDVKHQAFCAQKSAYKLIVSFKPQPYLKRNKSIVSMCDVLCATPATMREQLRSGTWSTVREARRQSKQLMIILPDGTISRK